MTEERTRCRCECGCNYEIISKVSIAANRCFSCRYGIHAGRRDPDLKKDIEA